MTENVADYTPPCYFTPATDLFFKLDKKETKVTAIFNLILNTTSTHNDLPAIELNGHKDTVINSLELNGITLMYGDDYTIVPDGNYIKLIIPNKFGNQLSLKQVVTLNPTANTSNEGAYISDGCIITQNESQGFRRIIFSVDRPDNLSVYTTTIEGDKHEFPVLLANGNEAKIDQPKNETKHRARFIDPYPKPSYLFALCCGQYIDKKLFYKTTETDKEKLLQVFAPIDQKLENLEFALDAAYRMMRWNEAVYNKELDLDQYKIVGASKFNAGAMENKGLNVFSANDVFLDPKYSTDENYRRVLTVIAHEIAHNWAGNRVTIRDWSQLSLKEGLATHIEQQFCRDILGKEVARINDVVTLRNHQFTEDASKLAHPVHPQKYEDISNFYTTTIYEKGSELLETLEVLLGKQTFIQGIKDYFDKYDGHDPSVPKHYRTGVTIEEFVRSLAKTAGRDLTQFLNWYNYAGTPEVTITDDFDRDTQTYSLTMEQFCPSSPNQENSKPPFLIPIKIGLLKPNGEEVTFVNSKTGLAETSTILELSQRKQTFTFSNMDGKPIPSLFRNFSAPVKMKTECLTIADKIYLIKNDTDAFVKWDCMQAICINEIKSQLKNYSVNGTIELNKQFSNLYKAVLHDQTIPLDFKTKLLTLPSYDYMLKQVDNVKPTDLQYVLDNIKKRLAIQNESYLNSIVNKFMYNPEIDASFSLDDLLIARQRDIFLFALNLLCYSKNEQYHNFALSIAEEKSNFTNIYSSYLSYFCSQGKELTIANNKINKTLFERFKDNDSLLQKWLKIQAQIPTRDAIDHIENLASGRTPGFDLSHPHQCYCLLQTFICSNSEFHDLSGRGYKVIADCLLKLDTEIKNHHVASVIAACFAPSDNMSEINKTLANRELSRLRQDSRISTGLKEVLDKSLAGTEFDPYSNVTKQTILFASHAHNTRKITQVTIAEEIVTADRSQVSKPAVL